jgi:hypothetical protein
VSRRSTGPAKWSTRRCGASTAALPAIRRAARLPLREALQASGSAVGGQGRLDAALRRVRGVPRSVQIGLRSVGRRKRHAAATAVQVSIAVATLLALLSLGAGIATITRDYFDDNKFDTWIQAVASKPLGADAERLIRSTPGVREAGMGQQRGPDRGRRGRGPRPPRQADDQRVHPRRPLAHRS